MSSSPTPDPHQELQQLLDGDLSPERFDQLQETLKQDPDLLREYLALVRTEHLLQEREWEGTESVSKTVAFPQPVRAGWWIASAACAAAVFLFLLVFNESQETNPALPAFRFAAHAVFEADTQANPDSGRIQEGDVVALRKGYVSIRLVSGAEAIIESPSSFAIEGDNRLRLDKGNATFLVPESAIGFTVQLPWLEVVDLGTVFTTEVDEGANRVYVEQGTVEVSHPTLLAEAHILVAGDKLTCIENQEIEVQADASLAHLREDYEKHLLFHDLLTYAPDQSLKQRDPLEGSWEIELGNPWVRDGHLDTKGKDTTAYGHFSMPVKRGGGVVLLYLRARSPKKLFHSKGWAGISLFDGSKEVFFFGDKSNDSYSWSFIPYRRDQDPRSRDLTPYDLQIQGGEESFTIRYHQASGQVEVFRGWGVTGIPVVELVTDRGLTFDRLRIGNESGGDFSFEEIRVEASY